MKKRETINYLVGDYVFNSEDTALSFENSLINSRHYYITFDTSHKTPPLFIVCRSRLQNAVHTYLIQTFGSPIIRTQSGNMVDSWQLYEKKDIYDINDVICFWYLYNKRYTSATRQNIKLPIIYIDEFGRDITSLILSEIHNSSTVNMLTSIDLDNAVEIPLNALDVQLDIESQLKELAGNDFTTCVTCANCHQYNKQLHCLANGGRIVKAEHACLKWSNS